MTEPRTAWRALPILSALLVVFAMSFPAIFWRGGVLEREATSFITAYSADRPFFEKIFDPRINDFGAYQARELSYLVDNVDAAAYRCLATFHRSFFAPLSTLVSSALLVLVFMTGVKRTTRNVDGLTATLWIACLLTSFQFVFTMGLFYRSSKPALAVLLLALMFYLARVLQRESTIGSGDSSSEARAGMTAFALALGCGLFDRQGFYYVVVAALLLAVHYLMTRQGRGLIVAVCYALIVLVVYNLIVAPSLIFALNGYRPDFSMQNIALGRGSIAAHPWLFVQAFQLLAENVGVLFGGVRAAGFLIVPVFLLLTAPAFRDSSRVLGRSAFVAFGFQWLMFALMIQKLPQFYDWIDHRYFYYPLPFLVTVLFFGVMGLDRLMPQLAWRGRWALRSVLIVISICNLWSLGGYRTLVAGGPWFSEIYPQSEQLKASLRNGAPDPALDKDYRAFYDFTMGMQNKRD